ncbi:hypothetical protein EVAR_5679_1 [Eumeta japonica]|uniref:Uncharacterized protein n=1 Tax=Eumeta variegata TaxID=151549 RepID=A0A4C1TA62_EUMVA|nr:hypothetical protein EVAR_5679_1 [Eumeta japonica]
MHKSVVDSRELERFDVLLRDELKKPHDNSPVSKLRPRGVHAARPTRALLRRSADADGAIDRPALPAAARAAMDLFKGCRFGSWSADRRGGIVGHATYHGTMNFSQPC